MKLVLFTFFLLFCLFGCEFRSVDLNENELRAKRVFVSATLQQASRLTSASATAEQIESFKKAVRKVETFEVGAFPADSSKEDVLRTLHEKEASLQKQ